ncbi:VOC family protein [Haliea salexigens]|uniref:VOC family protein n=1 Tax=Haliea salexigens TaxID=287487 RepID=UPI000488C73F|nr:VOC family protein [Haliea salexigens]
MTIKTAYFGFEVSDMDAWERYGELLGVGVERSAEGLFFRVDEKARRVHCIEGAADDIAWFGWEVDSIEELEQRRNHIKGQGINVEEGSVAEAQLRGVDQFFHFVDLNGTRFEIAHNLSEAGEFNSDKVEGGFVTGDLGVGHAAFNSNGHLADEKFMREVMSADLSDYIYQPMPDGSMMHASFLHTNPRHHSAAYAEGLGDVSVNKLNHFHLEVNTLSDFGTTYERLQEAGVVIAVSLGQHSNDKNLTFYAQTPSKFMFELGYGGITIDDEASWKPVIHDRISLWGHEFKQ